MTVNYILAYCSALVYDLISYYRALDAQPRSLKLEPVGALLKNPLRKILDPQRAEPGNPHSAATAQEVAETLPPNPE